MARGPLPQNKKARRNPPTIPTKQLPVGGRKAPAPNLPEGHRLGKRGKAYWRWAWRTSQAAAWDFGAVPFVMRRAELEDDLEALEAPFDIGDIPEDDESRVEWLKSVKYLVRVLGAMAGDKLKIAKEMREMEGHLGLTPYTLERNRWVIVPDEATEGADAETPAGTVADIEGARRRRLTEGA